MRKWSILVIFLVSVGMLFATSVGDDDVSPPEEVSASSSDDGGGGPDEPFEAMADTTADIYIYVTLRQPEGPPAPDFYIFDTDCSMGNENIYFKSAAGPGARDDCDFYLIYRAPWALFEWNDIWLFALPGQQDTATMIDPIDFPFGFLDAGIYRWGWKEPVAPLSPDSIWVGGESVYDFFLDSLVSASDSRGVCDSDTNWLYTAVAVDTNEIDGRLLYSPTPAPPVGEFDQWIYPGTNILSYPVDIGVTNAQEMGEELEDYDVRFLYQWQPTTQTWINIAAYTWFPFPPPGDSSWTGAATAMIPGACFRADRTVGVGELWSAYTPGYLPYDADLPVHTLTKVPAEATGLNYVTMPYQEYNILLPVHGSFPIPARVMLEDIPCAGEPDGRIYLYNNDIHTRQQIAYWAWVPFPPPGAYVATGDDPVYPGAPYIIEVQSECTWPPF